MGVIKWDDGQVHAESLGGGHAAPLLGRARTRSGSSQGSSQGLELPFCSFKGIVLLLLLVSGYRPGRCIKLILWSGN